MTEKPSQRTGPQKSYLKQRLPIFLFVVTAVTLLVFLTAKFGSTDPDEKERPGVLIHLNSLVGDPAPAFSLGDSEGTRYTVEPGGGRPLVIVFHMGTI